jgi:hypothetical protein
VWSLKLLHLGDGARCLAVLRIRLLDLQRHEVVVAARDEQQRRAIRVLVVERRCRPCPILAATTEWVALIECDTLHLDRGYDNGVVGRRVADKRIDDLVCSLMVVRSTELWRLCSVRYACKAPNAALGVSR